MGLVESQFSQDLDESVLADDSCWHNLRSSEHLKGPQPFPLPRSNSPAAKQMRIAAVLAVLSRTLHKHLFRPTYLLDHEADAPLTQLLRELEDANPAQEIHARSTLLAVLPQRQQSSAKKRVQSVVREVSWLVQHLLSALQYDTFCTGLEAICARACTQWMRIQEAQMKIEPYFGPPYTDFDWQVLPLPAFGGDGSYHSCHRRNDSEEISASPTEVCTDAGDDVDANDGDAGEAGEEAEGGAEVVPEEDMPAEEGDGEDYKPGGEDQGDADAEHGGERDASGAEAGDDDKAAEAEYVAISKPRSDDEEITHENAGSNSEEEDSEVDPSDILLVVWPSLCAVEGGALASITQGLVITKDQARAAFEEVRPRQGSRSHAKKARTMSMPGHSRRGSIGSPRKAFLFAGGGAGSDDGFSPMGSRDDE